MTQLLKESGLTRWRSGKNPNASAGDARNAGSILGSEWSPGVGNGNSLQYSCLENPMDRGAWRAIVHRAAKSRTRLKGLSMHAWSLGSLTTLNFLPNGPRELVWRFQKGRTATQISWPQNTPLLLGEVVLFKWACCFGREAYGAVEEEGDARLVSQSSQINPGDQWGDRHQNQIALVMCLF